MPMPSSFTDSRTVRPSTSVTSSIGLPAPYFTALDRRFVTT